MCQVVVYKHIPGVLVGMTVVLGGSMGVLVGCTVVDGIITVLVGASTARK